MVKGSRASRIGLGAVAVLAVAMLVARAAGELDGGTRVEIGDVIYMIPPEFRERPSENAMFLQFALPDWTALTRDVPGWEDNVNVLVEPLKTDTGRRASIPELYDGQYDGTPVGTMSNYSRIERIYRIETGLTVQEMGSGFDIVIPDQDMATMPLGIMRCTRAREFFPNPDCSLLFDHDSARWSVSFGRQFMADHAAIRARATDVIDGFRIGNGDRP